MKCPAVPPSSPVSEPPLEKNANAKSLVKDLLIVGMYSLVSLPDVFGPKVLQLWASTLVNERGFSWDSSQVACLIGIVATMVRGFPLVLYLLLVGCDGMPAFFRFGLLGISTTCFVCPWLPEVVRHCEVGIWQALIMVNGNL